MSIVERPARTMTEQAVDALASFEPMIDMVLGYADLTVAQDGIGKVEEAHKAVKRLRVDLDKKRKELNEGALHYQRTVNATAKTLTEKISVVEDRLEKERAAYDAEKLKEKQAKEAAKAAVLNERVARLSGAGIVVTDLATIGAMDSMDFEFFFAKESRIAEEAKASEELLHKIAVRIARMDALGVACPSADQIGALSDAQFEHDFGIAKRMVDERRERLQAEQEAEAKRQAEELRVRAEEMERQRLADEAAMAEQRKAMEAERAEMRRQQEEVNRQQAELRAKAEAEAAEQRRKEREAEEARKAEAEVARLEALKPEIEKAQDFAQSMITDAQDSLTRLGNPAWAGDAMHAVRNCVAAIIALVVKS
jgi:chromosome segregation ATPase